MGHKQQKNKTARKPSLNGLKNILTFEELKKSFSACISCSSLGSHKRPVFGMGNTNAKINKSKVLSNELIKQNTYNSILHRWILGVS